MSDKKEGEPKQVWPGPSPCLNVEETTTTMSSAVRSTVTRGNTSLGSHILNEIRPTMVSLYFLEGSVLGSTSAKAPCKHCFKFSDFCIPKYWVIFHFLLPWLMASTHLWTVELNWQFWRLREQPFGLPPVVSRHLSASTVASSACSFLGQA